MKFNSKIILDRLNRVPDMGAQFENIFRYVLTAATLQSERKLSANDLKNLSKIFQKSLPAPLKEKFTETLLVLDHNDQPIGHSIWLLVRLAGLKHSGVLLMITRQNEVLLSQRANDISDGGSLDFTAGGGLSVFGEKAVKKHAIQELFEEVFSLPISPLMSLQEKRISFLGHQWVNKEDGKFGLVYSKNFVHHLAWNSDLPPIRPNNESKQVLWMPREKFLELPHRKNTQLSYDLKVLFSNSELITKLMNLVN